MANGDGGSVFQPTDTLFDTGTLRDVWRFVHGMNDGKSLDPLKLNGHARRDMSIPMRSS